MTAEGSGLWGRWWHPDRPGTAPRAGPGGGPGLGGGWWRPGILLAALLACSSVDEQLADLASPDARVREAAAYHLLMKGKGAAPGLIALVDTGSTDRPRYIATQLLGKIGDPAAVEPLIRQLRQAGATALRQAAAEALGKLGDERAIEPLRQALQTETAVVVRVAAVQGLSTLRLADARVYEAALADWHPDVRRAALVALARFAPDELARQLPALCSDPDPRVRYLVVQLLDRHLGQAAVPALIAALEDSTGAIREEAARALGRLKAAPAKEALIDLMARSDDPDGDAARQALRQITGVDWVPVD